MEAAARPLPREETTPPVTKMYLGPVVVSGSVPQVKCGTSHYLQNALSCQILLRQTFHGARARARRHVSAGTAANRVSCAAQADIMEKRIFWAFFIGLSLFADFTLSLLWGLLATIPVAAVSWWVAYRSGWFR